MVGCGESRSQQGVPYFPPGVADGGDTDDDGTEEATGDTGDDDVPADDGGPGGEDGRPTDDAADDGTDDGIDDGDDGMDDGDAGTDDGADAGMDDGGPPPTPGAACSEDALILIDLLNEYRAGLGLAAIPPSSSLCIVGDAHVADLANHNPAASSSCNLHSWSDAGPWSSCCYTSDHAQAECMWNKPSELTDYPGPGFENAAGGAGAELLPHEALHAWQTSSGHNEVMTNSGVWADSTWKAVGAGIDGGYAVLWFGEQSDPADQ